MIVSFEDFKLQLFLMQVLIDINFCKLIVVQEKLILVIVVGCSVIGQLVIGSGKMYMFLLLMIN